MRRKTDVSCYQRSNVARFSQRGRAAQCVIVHVVGLDTDRLVTSSTYSEGIDSDIAAILGLQSQGTLAVDFGRNTGSRSFSVDGVAQAGEISRVVDIGGNGCRSTTPLQVEGDDTSTGQVRQHSFSTRLCLHASRAFLSIDCSRHSGGTGTSSTAY
ncbi:hypothetical protein D9M68_697080 [compost metagenome]